MKYYKRTENGYIILVGTNCGGEEITKKEYNEIMQVIHNKPTASEGYDYKLTESLEWELCEIPVVEIESADEEATETEYLSALESLGVKFNA